MCSRTEETAPGSLGKSPVGGNKTSSTSGVSHPIQIADNEETFTKATAKLLYDFIVAIRQTLLEGVGYFR